MTRTRITTDRHGDVIVERDNPVSGERESTTYFVARSSDDRPTYVRIRDEAGNHPQVCEKLQSRGNTLTATKETLTAVIRRELRRCQRLERRELDGGF